MVPARTTSPVWRFTPRRFAWESRPLRELPPPFLCAIAWVLLGFGCPCALRRRRLRRGRLLLGLSLDGLLHSELGDRDLGLDGLGFGSNRGGHLGDGLGLRCNGVGFRRGLRRRRALWCRCLGLGGGLAASDLIDEEFGQLTPVPEGAPVALLGLVREHADLASAPVGDHGCW